MTLKIAIDNEKKRLNANDWIEILIICLMFVSKVTPQLQYSFTGLKWSLLYHVVFGLWLVFTLMRYPNWILRTREFLGIWRWLLYLGLTFLIFSNTQWGYFSLLLSFWEPLIIFYHYTQIDNNPRKRELIAWITVAALAYGLFSSIQTVNMNELAAREASSGHSSNDAVLTGNYSFTAAITVIWGAMVCYLQSSKLKDGKIKALLALFIAVGAFVFVFRCNLMISIVSLLVAVVFYVAMNDKKHFNLSRTMVLILGIGVMYFLWPIVCNMLASGVDALGNWIGSATITDRTAYLSMWLRGGGMDGNLESRMELCRIALNTFFHHPIFGIGPQNNAVIYFRTELGLHATFFDEWARFGVVGMVFLIAPFISFYKYVCRITDEGAPLRAFKAGFYIFIVISMLNPVASANIGIALFYIVPIIVIASQTGKVKSL